jgi:Fe-S-cluster containining protein
VSFYWAEAEARGLAEKLTEKLDHFQSCMAGTNQVRPHCRCEALRGTVGQCVTCAVYDQRPSPCRDLTLGSAQCQQARVAYGLPPVP